MRQSIQVLKDQYASKQSSTLEDPMSAVNQSIARKRTRQADIKGREIPFIALLRVCSYRMKGLYLYQDN